MRFRIHVTINIAVFRANCATATLTSELQTIFKTNTLLLHSKTVTRCNTATPTNLKPGKGDKMGGRADSLKREQGNVEESAEWGEKCVSKSALRPDAP